MNQRIGIITPFYRITPPAKERLTIVVLADGLGHVLGNVSHVSPAVAAGAIVANWLNGQALGHLFRVKS